jgi:hypothetical protein
VATQEELDNWFTYHPPQPEQLSVYRGLREWAMGFAQAFNDVAPECADKTAAMRKLRDTLMAMNLTIACNP